MFPFVRYKILLRFSITLYFVSLFLLSLLLLLFFRVKDDVLFPNVVKRNFKSQNSPYFSRKPRTRNSRTNGLEQMVVPSCLEQVGGGGASATGERSEKYVSKIR